MKRFSFRAIFALLVSALALSFALGAPVVLAQTEQAPSADVGLNEIGSTVRLSGTDPRTIVVRIINISLSLIGIILVSIIVYAGFLWMTSGGNPEQIEKAKKYLKNAIIGLLIILSSWAITRFVINALLDSTNSGGSGTNQTQSSGANGGSFGSAGVSGGFVLESVEPEGTIGIRNVQVRFLFSQAVSAEDVATRVHVLTADGGQPVAGRFETDGDLVTFTPSAACPAPNADRFCLEANTEYVARVDASMHSASGQTIACGGLGAVCEGRFKTGETVDVTGPTATLLQPFEGQSIPQNSSVEVIGAGSDDSGVSLLEFSADGRVIGRDSPPQHQVQASFEGRAIWNTAGLSLGAHQVRVSSFDMDSNRTDSATVAVMVRAESCFNNQLDEGEADIDCGGGCGACAGSACQVGSECAGGVCASGRCVERPIITAITPNSGRVGTIITISGSNFGASGEVTFAGGVHGSFPQVCASALGSEGGSTGWSDTSIVVEVPVGAQTGPISVKNSASGLTDGSDDETGPRVGAYTVNEVTHPGLCAITPDHGPISTAVQLDGEGFGSSSDRVRVGDMTVSAFRGWTNERILLNIPSIQNGVASVRAVIGEQQTNPVAFSVEVTQPTAPPVIEAVEPSTGPIGEYITLRGRNFGTRAGRVRVAGLNNAEGDGDTTFPAACDQATRYWSDTSVTFKIPATLNTLGLGGTVPVAPGAYQVFLQRQDGSSPSNRMDLTVTTGEPSPGLCALTPDTGPVGTEVTFVGERFGGDQGQVSFQGPSRSVDSLSIVEWSDQQVRAIVPPGAVTGAVSIKTNNQSSNPLPYTVRNCSENASICSENERCCEGSGVCVSQAGGVCPAISSDAHYAWRVSTGELPIYPEVAEECNPASRRLASPSPANLRPGGDQACVNTDIIVRFTTRIDPNSIDGSSFVVRQCADATSDCSQGTIVTPAVGFPRVEAADTGTDLIRFRPSSNSERWSAATNYQVFLTTAVRTPRGISMPENEVRCGSGYGYCFRFATRTSTELCTVGSVLVNPSSYRFEDLDEEVAVHANPLAADDACLQLNPDSYPWSWSVTDRAGRSDARVAVTGLTASLGQSADQTATARAEVDAADPSLVTATMTGGRTGVSGFSEMSVALKTFTIDSYGPDCDSACVNASIWAKFSTPVQVASVTPANIILRRCADAECHTMDDPFSLPPNAIRITAIPGETGETGLGRFLLINPSGNLRVGQRYRILLRSGAQGGIVSTRGQSLASMNDPLGFAWIFQMKADGDGRCTADQVLLAPNEKTESVVGARQRFTAVPLSGPTSCSETGEYLISDQPYAWSVVNASGAADASVARLVERTDDPSADDAPFDQEAPVRAGSSTDDQQLAEITAVRDPGEGQTRLTTNIQASYDGRSGRATYGLLCGQRVESACPSGSGLTAGGCCAPRPVIVSRYPGILPASTGNDICRNTEIFADFQVPIDSGSVSSSIILAKKETAVTCPAQTQSLDRALLGLTDHWYTRAWSRIVAFFTPNEAHADIWCVGAVPGTVELVPQGTGSRVIYRIQNALEANTEYRVYIRGEANLAAPIRNGVRSERGVMMAQEAVNWSFRTGTRICEANSLSVDDTSAESPYLYTHHPETHQWQGVVQALSAAGQVVPITSVREYTWDWGPWLASNPDILLTSLVDARVPTRANVVTNNKNGQTFVSGRFQISHDEVNTPSTTGRVITAAKSATVNLCQRPWPSLSLGSFTDGPNSASLRALAPMFENGPFYHFSTMYCMDGADKASSADDLPSMHLNPVPLNAADTAQGILRQYLFTFTEPALRGDGIGIRVAANPLHLSAARWYAAQSFAGAPAAMTVDGYDAVRSGDTIYISASDKDEAGGGTIVSRIYILSRNPNATEITSEIYDQLVANFILNTNLSDATENVCVQPMPAGGSSVYLENQQPVRCSADWECAVHQTSLQCASEKAKMQRDRTRINDFQTFNGILETYRQQSGFYPKLESGSFLQGMSTSRWPSWSQTLGSALGGNDSIPRDPVNRYLTCGRCQAGNGTLGTVCSETSECSAGQTCAAMTGEDATRNGFDPATCWNASAQRYMCPAIQVGGQTLQDSHVYQYRSIGQGTQYELATNFEGPDATLYRPTLVTNVSRCTNTSQICTSNSQCTGGATCRPTGGTWAYGNVCQNREYTATAACAATGPLASGQRCHLGDTQVVACTVNGQPGTKIQTCSACTDFIDGPQTICTPNISCGNGQIDAGETCDDGANNGRYGFCSRTCQQVQGMCGDGVVGGGELCDNGSPIGSSGDYVNGAYCNGTGCNVAQSCSLDCRARAPNCGDGSVDGPEQCDGTTNKTSGKLCVRENDEGVHILGVPCTQDSECGVGGTCGTWPRAAACAPEQVRQCSGGTNSGTTCSTDLECSGGGRCIGLTYPTYHVQTCGAPGQSNQCQLGTWSACQMLSSCGDGVIDAVAGEECDDGVSGNSGTGRCTPRCKLNTCGDGYAQTGVEDCDLGGRNGVAPATLQYGTPSPMCTTSCRYSSVSGGFCGNNLLEANEECDGTAIPLDATCRSLRYDYAVTRTSGGRDALSCNNRCSIAGCALCSAPLTPGQGAIIRAKVVDGILQNRGLPQARVSLRYNGASVAETYTDTNGYFQFSGLHDNEACGNYSIGISLQGVKYNYSRRELVTTSDPNDGYYAFTSAPFTAAVSQPTSFASVVGRQSGADRVILLMPHPGEGETIVVREWNNTVEGRVGVGGRPQVGQLIDPQLVLPMALGYEIVTPPDVLYRRCLIGTPNILCHRTINWQYSPSGSRRGSLNMSVPPNAGLACYEGGGDNTCSSYDAVAETIMYKRAVPTTGAVYRYFLVDASTTDGDGDGNLDTVELQNKVRIIWRDSDGMEHYQELSPTPGGATRGGDGRCRKYWHVFDQDSITGRVTIVNKYMCNSTVEGVDPDYTQILDDDNHRKNIESVLTDTFST